MSTRKRSSIVSSAKAYERKVASLTGGRRNPSTGLLHEIDVQSGDLSIQCKKGQRMPGYLRQWLDGIVESAGTQAPGTLPMVVWNTWGADALDSVVVIRFGDFLAWRAGEGKSLGSRTLQGRLAVSQARVRFLTNALDKIEDEASRAVESIAPVFTILTETTEDAAHES